jgi:hypothetical protein
MVAGGMKGLHGQDWTGYRNRRRRWVEGTCSRSLLGVRGDEHGEKSENEGGKKHGDRRLKGEVGGFS